MKKILTVLLSIAMIFCLVGCSSSTSDETTGGDEATTSDGKDVAVFWYSYSDAYISTVRAALNKALDDAGVSYDDYDGNSSQTDQLNQVTTALAGGAKVLIVNQVEANSTDTTQTILEQAEAAGAKVLFFNRSISDDDTVAEELLNQYGSAFIGTNYEDAGHMEGELIGEYVLANYDTVDLNGDGKISYMMLKGQEGNAEAEARTQYSVEDANAILTAGGKEELVYFDESASTKYQVDSGGNWSAAEGTNFTQTNLGNYNEANGNMIELVIANNDDMALGAIEALKNAGYNTGDGTTIPVFGVDALDAAVEAINAGSMTGTIKQDGQGMATVIALCAQNLLAGNAALTDIPSDYNVIGTWRVNIPYSKVTG